MHRARASRSIIARRFTAAITREEFDA